MKLIGLSVAKAEAAPCGRHTKKWKLCAWRFFATRLLSVIALVPSNVMTLLAPDMCIVGLDRGKIRNHAGGKCYHVPRRVEIFDRFLAETRSEHERVGTGAAGYRLPIFPHLSHYPPIEGILAEILPKDSCATS